MSGCSASSRLCLVSPSALRYGEGLSPAPSRVDRCAHQAADNAVVTTASVHSTGATNAARGRIIRLRVARSVGAASTVARAPLLRLMIHLARAGENAILDRSERVVGESDGGANDGSIDVYRRAPRMSLETSRGKRPLLSRTRWFPRDVNPDGCGRSLPACHSVVG